MLSHIEPDVTCNIWSRCTRHWAPRAQDAWRCQSRTASGFQTQDQAEDSGGEKLVMIFCLKKQDCYLGLDVPVADAV